MIREKSRNKWAVAFTSDEALLGRPAIGALRLFWLLFATIAIGSLGRYCAARAAENPNDNSKPISQRLSDSKKIHAGWSPITYKNGRIIAVGQYVLPLPLILPKSLLAINSAYICCGNYRNREILAYFYFRADSEAKIRNWADETPPRVPLAAGSFTAKYTEGLIPDDGGWLSSVIVITRLGSESFNWNATSPAPVNVRLSKKVKTIDNSPPGYDAATPIGHQKRLIFLAASLRWRPTTKN